VRDLVDMLFLTHHLYRVGDRTAVGSLPARLELFRRSLPLYGYVSKFLETT